MKGIYGYFDKKDNTVVEKLEQKVKSKELD